MQGRQALSSAARSEAHTDLENDDCRLICGSLYIQLHNNYKSRPLLVVLSYIFAIVI